VVQIGNSIGIRIPKSLLKQIGKITEKDSQSVCNTLIEMFTY
jgi:antitoxin component of MazEF toxin-antitoxin module